VVRVQEYPNLPVWLRQEQLQETFLRTKAPVSKVLRQALATLAVV
jgi:hypothetical protein